MNKFISLSGLKTLLEPLIHLINKKAERLDWNENDPNSPSYIGNRICYEKSEVKEVLSFKNLPTEYVEEYDISWYKNYDGIQLNISPDKFYDITVNGITYNNVKFQLEVVNDSFSYYYIMTEDFYFEFVQEDYFVVQLPGNIPSVTISFTEKVTEIKKIDKKYIPLPGEATIEAAGLMSPADKDKLDLTNVAYGLCYSAPEANVKSITIEGNYLWTPRVGSKIAVYFSNTNTSMSTSFDVNGTGAKKVKYNNEFIANKLQYAGLKRKVLEYVYDGENYVYIGSALEDILETTLTVPTTGWMTNETYGTVYFQDFTVPGVSCFMDIYINCYVGPKFPLIGAKSIANNQVILYMSEVPTVAQTISIKFKG